MEKFSKQDLVEMCPLNIQHSDLNDSTKVILGALINAENCYSEHNKREGYFHVANSTLSEMTDYAKPTVIKELGRLSNDNMLGFLTRVSGAAHRQSRYQIDWSKVNAYGNAEVKSEVKSEVKTDTQKELTNTLPIEYSIIEDRIKKIEEIEYNNNIILNNIYNILKNKINNIRPSSTNSDEVEEEQNPLPSIVKDSGFTAPTVSSSFNISKDDSKSASEPQDFTSEPFQVEEIEVSSLDPRETFRDKMLSIPKGLERLRWCMNEYKLHNIRWKQSVEWTIKANCVGFREWLDSGMSITAEEAIDKHQRKEEDEATMKLVGVFDGWE